MRTQIHGSPSFARVESELAPGDSIICQKGAMQSMAAELDMKVRPNGGFWSALGKSFCGESFFATLFSNNSDRSRTLVFSQPEPGQILEEHSSDEPIYLKAGAFVAMTPGLSLKLSFGGFGSMLAGKGLVRLKTVGHGTLWFGGFGHVIKREVQGELVVDNGHILALKGDLKLKPALVGGLFTSLASGEGLVTRVRGTGTIYIQSRSLGALARWLNSFFR